MKSIATLILILGLLFLVMGYYQIKQTCPTRKIEYRYIPRQFYEEQVSETNLKNLYSDMFNKPTTWSRYPVGNTDSELKANLEHTRLN